MKNKIYAWGLHFLIVVVYFFIFLAIVQISYTLNVDILKKYNWAIVLIIFAVHSFIPFCIKPSSSHFSNFTVGLLITLSSLLLWGVTMACYNSDLLRIDYSDEIFWIVFYSYLLPFKPLFLILNIKFSPILNLVMCFAPCLTIGIGLTIKYKLLKHKL